MTESCKCSVGDTGIFETQTFVVKIGCIFSQRQFKYEKCIRSLIPFLFYLIAILLNLIQVTIQIPDCFNSFNAVMAQFVIYFTPICNSCPIL